jgi:hypothetical protein
VFTDTEDLFFVDFLNNVLPSGESLYTVISIYNSLNRWSGRGWYELYADVMEDSDRLWCEMRHEMGMAANPMIGTHEDVLDDMNISEVQFRPGATVPLLEGKTMKEFMDPYVQPDTSNLRMKVLEFRMRIHELETGATSPARGDIAGQPSNATATGTQSILASGTTLQKLPADEIKEGFECLMRKEIALLYAAHDKAETFAYGEGENQVLLTLTPEDVRGLAVNVRVLMTRFKDRENATNTKAALDVRAQYLSEPPEMQATGRKFYIQLAKALGIQNADELFPPPAPPDPNAVPVQDASERVNFNLKDMPPSTQAAALQGIGLPADAAEIAAMQEKAKPAPAASKPPAK